MKPARTINHCSAKARLIFNEVFAALKAINYQGKASVELSRHSYVCCQCREKSMELSEEIRVNRLRKFCSKISIPRNNVSSLRGVTDPEMRIAFAEHAAGNRQQLFADATRDKLRARTLRCFSRKQVKRPAGRLKSNISFNPAAIRFALPLVIADDAGSHRNPSLQRPRVAPCSWHTRTCIAVISTFHQQPPSARGHIPLANTVKPLGLTKPFDDEHVRIVRPRRAILFVVTERPVDFVRNEQYTTTIPAQLRNRFHSRLDANAPVGLAGEQSITTFVLRRHRRFDLRHIGLKRRNTYRR